MCRAYRRRRILILAIAAVLAARIVSTPAELAAQEPACAGLALGPARTVTRIIDAETVALDDGGELRLIGTLAPRAIDVGGEPGQWPLEIAAREELRALTLGRSIELGFGGERTDRYGRLQAHAFIRQGDERRWVQGHMLRQGLARAFTMAGNRACGAELLAAEWPAREARRGLWAEAAYRVLSTERPIELLRQRATFQLVEGRIQRVASVRGVMFLNFEGGRGGFSAYLRHTDAALLGLVAADASATEGKAVRVRGWIEERNGAPVIDLSVAGQIELLPAPEAQPPGLIETGRLQ